MTKQKARLLNRAFFTVLCTITLPAKTGTVALTSDIPAGITSYSEASSFTNVYDNTATTSFGSQGWFKINSIIVNWGVIIKVSTSHFPQTITFTKAFSSGVTPSVVLAMGPNGNGFGLRHMSITNTSFKTSLDVLGASVFPNGSTVVTWIAIGH